LGQEYRYTSLRPEADGWSFHGEQVGPEVKIYGMTNARTLHFDSKRGALHRAEEESAQDYGFKGKGSGSTELTRVESRDGAWLSAFSQAADRYFAASAAYEKATEKASKESHNVEGLLADAKAALEKARGEIDHPIFREQLDHKIKRHEGMV